MKFFWITKVRKVKDHQPILAGRKDKETGQAEYEYAERRKLVVTEDHIGFLLPASEAPAVGTQLIVTIETVE